ncbi:hypothetical protein DSL72_004443 [Monilinia vaccinii-corymbosi]|uniref:Cyanovirin-N domain-containing protein n=1 Tax=Monilinia vaccinii-corymbosi TaxID=61207 RepID=A0A8A3NW37_9HELO|nr:hypothetical protein DSL72_004443 [Monilinia vaccinii-corymbosi]
MLSIKLSFFALLASNLASVTATRDYLGGFLTDCDVKSLTYTDETQVLTAKCKIAPGRTAIKSINLNTCISNRGGVLSWDKAVLYMPSPA